MNITSANFPKFSTRSKPGEGVVQQNNNQSTNESSSSTTTTSTSTAPTNESDMVELSSEASEPTAEHDHISVLEMARKITEVFQGETSTNPDDYYDDGIVDDALETADSAGENTASGGSAEPVEQSNSDHQSSSQTTQQSHNDTTADGSDTNYDHDQNLDLDSILSDYDTIGGLDLGDLETTEGQSGENVTQSNNETQTNNSANSSVEGEEGSTVVNGERIS